MDITDVLGQTGGIFLDGTPYFDHLHLAIFFARGFARPDRSDNAFYLNPMLMYTSDIFDLHYPQTYFPYILGTRNLVADSLGIQGDQLNQWSAGGFNFYPNGRSANNTFWYVQNYSAQFPINEVEWPYDNYPLIPSNDPLRIEELVEYLNQSFDQFPYVAPDCAISVDNNRTPPREIADAACYDSPDLYDDTSYNAVAHVN